MENSTFFLNALERAGIEVQVVDEASFAERIKRRKELIKKQKDDKNRKTQNDHGDMKDPENFKKAMSDKNVTFRL